jgi:hypothetical protein
MRRARCCRYLPFLVLVALSRGALALLASAAAVGLDERVSAVKFVASLAMRDLGSAPQARPGATGVLRRRDGLQVLRVDARPVSAEVIELKAVRDGTDERLVRGAVGDLVNGLSIHALREHSVTPSVLAELPFPAA